MEARSQSLEEILSSLQSLDVEWQDETAIRVIAEIEAFPIKPAYNRADLERLLDKNFDDALLIFRSFLGFSADKWRGSFKGGVKAYRKDRAAFLTQLEKLGLLGAMATTANRQPKWSDILVERLRTGRGSAISGQKRGRGVEDFAETVIKKVFGDRYDARCNFTGKQGATAKCDFAIPNKESPRILVEAKGYGATGSKMTDVIGDIEKIINAKRSDTTLLFLTDGVTWNQRKSDLRKIVKYQSDGDIARIYTLAMAEQFEEDLRLLRQESRIA